METSVTPMTSVELIEELFFSQARTPMTREQCLAQNLPFPADLVKTTFGVNAAVSICGELLRANIPIKPLSEIIKLLPPKTLHTGRGMKPRETSILSIVEDQYHGLLIPEGGFCALQVSILH